MLKPTSLLNKLTLKLLKLPPKLNKLLKMLLKYQKVTALLPAVVQEVLLPLLPLTDHLVLLPLLLVLTDPLSLKSV
jgi:hypothetical protein